MEAVASNPSGIERRRHDSLASKEESGFARQKERRKRNVSGERSTLILAMKAQMKNILECVKACGGGKPKSK